MKNEQKIGFSCNSRIPHEKMYILVLMSTDSDGIFDATLEELE